jgi:hypothetical protein
MFCGNNRGARGRPENIPRAERENEKKTHAFFCECNPHSPNGCIFYNLLFDMCVYANPLPPKSYAKERKSAYYANGDGSGFV